MRTLGLCGCPPFAYFDGASRTLRRFDWLHRRRDGVWVLTVVRYPHTICTCSCVVGAYMGLARPEKGTGHVPTFNHSERESLGVLKGRQSRPGRP